MAQGCQARAHQVAPQGWSLRPGRSPLIPFNQDSPDHYTVTQTLQTAVGSRNMGLDPTSHRIYIAAGKFGPPPATGRGRAPLLPGSFSLLVIERGAPAK